MQKSLEVTTPNGVVRGVITEARSSKGLLLCLHGTPNGDFHGNANVFDELAHIAEGLGFTTVQFSFWGSAPSDGAASQTSMKSQSADFVSMLEYVRANYSCPVHIVGESAGATVAALNWHHDVASYILLWPAFDLRDTDLRPFLTSRWQAVIEAQGYLESDGITLGRELFEELLFTDFEPCFKIPNIKTLLLHGRADKEVPYSQSLRAVLESVGDVTFVTANATGHGFKERRGIVLSAVAEWLRDDDQASASRQSSDR